MSHFTAVGDGGTERGKPDRLLARSISEIDGQKATESNGHGTLFVLVNLIAFFV